MLDAIKNTISLAASSWYPCFGFPEGAPNPSVAGDVLNKKEIRATALSDTRTGLNIFSNLAYRFSTIEEELADDSPIGNDLVFKKILRKATEYEAIKQIMLYGYSEVIPTYLSMVLKDKNVVSTLLAPTRVDFSTAVNSRPELLDRVAVLPLSDALRNPKNRDVVKIHGEKYTALFHLLEELYLPPDTLWKVLKAVWAAEVVASAINRDDITFYHSVLRLTEYSESRKLSLNKITYWAIYVEEVERGGEGT